jgi:DNA-binding IclR family transcriptional regulator
MNRRSSADKASGAPPSGDDERGSQSIGRALNILEEIAEHDAPLSLSQLARATGLTTPTAHRMLATLEQRRMVLRDPLTGGYSLGPTVLHLARAALRQGADGDLASTALVHMRQLRDETGETVGLHVIRHDQRLCVAELASHEPIRMASGIGATHPLGIGAVGKVLLAHAPAETIDRVAGLPEFQAAGRLGKTLPAIHRSLAEIRAAGYSTSFGETVRGASAIAVPILGSAHEVRGAINVTGPQDRWNEREMLAHLPGITTVVAWLERRLGRSEIARPAPGPAPRGNAPHR